jgi:hypothetical protein
MVCGYSRWLSATMIPARQARVAVDWREIDAGSQRRFPVHIPSRLGPSQR